MISLLHASIDILSVRRALIEWTYWYLMNSSPKVSYEMHARNFEKGVFKTLPMSMQKQGLGFEITLGSNTTL